MRSFSLSGVLAALRKPPASYEQARRLARLACLAVGIHGVWALGAFIFLRPSPDRVIAELQRVRGPVSLDEAAIDQVMFERIANIFIWLSGTVTGLVVLVCIGLGIWQWRRPGWIMPLICLCIMVIATGMALWVVQTHNAEDVALQVPNLILMALKPLLAILLIAAYRGGRYCHQYRMNPL